MSIKTTARNQIWVLQKRIGKQWCMIRDAYFPKRSQAREASRELNNVAGVTGRGPNRRYRVVVMRPVQNVSDTGQ